MNADDLARRIVVRHREAGYLRLELPGEICHATATTLIEDALRQVVGVYRVNVYLAQRRLAVWYEAHACSAADVARALKACLGRLPPLPDAAPDAISAPSASMPAVSLLPVLAEAGRQAGRLLGELGGRVGSSLGSALDSGADPAGVKGKLQPVLSSALSEKAITNFLNDVVAFYLIRVHWDLISKRWLQEPIKHANAWLTVFYLVFLLVRYRKSLAKPAPVAVAEIKADA
jgi:hypothetical protein